MSFESALKPCELIGFDEFQDVSSPPLKFRRRAVTGTLQQDRLGASSNCTSVYPGAGTQNFDFTGDAILYHGSVSCALDYISNGLAYYTLTAASVTSDNTGYSWTVRVNAQPNPPVVINIGDQFHFQVGALFELSIYVGITFGFAVGAVIYEAGRNTYTDVWDLFWQYDPFTTILTNGGTALRTSPNFSTIPVPDTGGGVTNGNPPPVYVVNNSPFYGPIEQTYTTNMLSRLSKDTIGLGCVLPTGPFQWASLLAVGTLANALTDEDIEADAIFRATPSPGVSNVAFYQIRTGFTFLYQTVDFSADAAGLVAGTDYTITVPIVTEDYGGGSPVNSNLVFSFTAIGITHNVNYSLVAPRGKQVTVGTGTITGAFIAPTLTTPAIAVNGNQWSFLFSEPVQIGGGGSGGFVPTVSGGAVVLTYASGAGTNVLVYNGSRAVVFGETATLAYTQPGNGIKDTTGIALESFSGLVVTNNSEVNMLATLSTATVGTNGLTWSLLFNAAVQFGAGGNGGFAPVVAVGSITLTYVSGAGTNTLVYTGSRSVRQSESPTLNYTQPGAGLIRTSSGVDVVSFAGHAVVNSSTATAALADGGTVTEVGGMRIHTFNAGGNFDVLIAGVVNYLVVGAGGGGNGGVFAVNFGCGGAGGTVKSGTGFAVTVQTYAITIGVGGAGTFTSTSGNGTSSVFASVTATGGTGMINSSRTGGSNADHAGGTNASGTNAGGGAGGGGDGSGSNGGVGTSSSISGAATFYASGGGGGEFGTASAGGGTPGIDGAAADAAANSGGGGGGGSSGGGGGDGGSGKVIIAYPI